MAYTFNDDEEIHRRRRGSNNNTTQNIYTFGDASELSQSNDFNDGNSLTYSASSSQAGESTDSSVADIEFLRMVEKEQQYHLNEKSSSFRRQNSLHRESGRGSNGRAHRRGDSASSATYSDAGDYVYRSSKRDTSRPRSTTSGQPSAQDSYNHRMLIFAPANNNNHHHHNNATKTTPNHAKTRSDFSSPTMVSTDVSGSASGSAGSVSVHTPSRPRSKGSPTPPRHVKRLSGDESEVWYQKWWMCGFTDALNLNSDC